LVDIQRCKCGTAKAKKRQASDQATVVTGFEFTQHWCFELIKNTLLAKRKLSYGRPRLLIADRRKRIEHAQRWTSKKDVLLTEGTGKVELKETTKWFP
jgi:hypothetical protein